MIIRNLDSCCGCNACFLGCPVRAIQPKIDSHGFYKVSIDKEKCIDCGYCEKVCPINNYQCHSAEYDAFSFKINSFEQRLISQSGGAFYAIADEFIKKKGIVYGVAFDEKKAFYKRISKKHEIVDLCGSKYIQAFVGDIYLSVEEDLQQNRKVLFSGTPCHVMGLLNYLTLNKVEKRNLVTIDLICHGTPTSLLYSDYKKLLESNYGEITKFSFRDKIYGWHGCICSFYTKHGKYYSKDFVTLFYSDLCLNRNCFECKYSSLNRVGDITIGDLWGNEKDYPWLNENIGISLLKVNTESGKTIVKNIEKAGKIQFVDINKCYQRNLYLPTPMPSLYDEFWKCYLKKGFKATAQKILGADFVGKTNKEYFWTGFNIELLFMRIKKVKLFLYGIGATMFQLIELLKEEDIKIHGIIDRNNDYAGQKYKGTLIWKQEDIPVNSEFTVLICSKNENSISDICERLKKDEIYKHAEILSLIEFMNNEGGR